MLRGENCTVTFRFDVRSRVHTSSTGQLETPLVTKPVSASDGVGAIGTDPLSPLYTQVPLAQWPVGVDTSPVAPSMPGSTVTVSVWPRMKLAPTVVGPSMWNSHQALVPVQGPDQPS